MRISKKNDNSAPEYFLYGSQLKAVSNVKDLGIHITSNPSWSLQTNKCENKANSEQWAQGTLNCSRNYTRF